MEKYVNKKVFIRAFDGKYLRANDKDGFDFSNGGGGWETFTIKDRDGGHYALLTAHGTYMKAHPGRSAKVEHEDYIGGWEMFKFRQEEGGKFAIQTAHETWLSANNKGKLDTELGIGEAEKFLIESAEEDAFDLSRFVGSYVAFKSAHNTFIRASAKKGKVDATDGVGSEESFKIIPLQGGNAHIQTTHGTYLRADDRGHIDHKATEAGAWETFKIIEHGNGCSLKTNHNTFVCVDGKAVGVRPHAGGWETFEIVQGQA